MKKFEEDHKKALPNVPLPEFGFPDCGNGRFSVHLTYAQWHLMSCGQRVQHNYLETISFAMFACLVAGIHFAQYTFYCQIMYLVGRLVYALGYLYGGGNYRLAGAITMDAGLIGILGMAGSCIYNLYV